MALILLYEFYGSPYQSSPGVWKVDGEKYTFDTTNQGVIRSTVSVTGADEREVANEPNYSHPTDVPVWDHCVGTTRRFYYHDGYGYVIVQDELNSLHCGYIPKLNLSANVAIAKCFGSNTGNITLNIGAGTAPYTFKWSDGATTKDRTGVAAGKYSVTVTDSTGIVDSLYNIVVGQNSEIKVTGTIGEDSILIEVTGGTGPYTFLWQDGVTSRNRTDVVPGQYSLEVMDSLGCKQTVNFSISEERFYFSKNPIILKLQANNPATKPNLRFLCEVWVEPVYLSGNFVKATPEPFEHPADASGATSFDVAEILDAFVEPHLPEFNQATVQMAGKTFKRFFLRHTEVYGDPFVSEPFTIQDNRYVLYGGLDDQEHLATTYYTSFFRNRKPFFTWDPVVKSVFQDQPELLYFMPDSYDLIDFRVVVKVSFTDGSTSTLQPFVKGGIKRFELYSIPVGYTQLALAQVQPAKQVKSWDVYVVDGFNKVLSETRRFVLNTRHFENLRYFIYSNSVGGYNTLAATGRAKLNVDAQAKLIERNRPKDTVSGDVSTISKHSKRTLQCSTGHKSKEEMEALLDFLNSEDVKLVEAGRYVPGVLADKSMTIKDDDNTVQGISFDFILPKMHRFTPSLNVGGYTDQTHLLTPLRP